MKNILKKLTLLLSYFAFVPNLKAEGLDKKIDSLFTPVADIIEAIIFFEIPGTSMPLVLLLVVVGGVFFTFYFKFPNIRLFLTSIKLVKGDYSDKLHDGSEGEVSHFQALATAVSGTVGMGNIAGVAIAIALGGPGATFWMILCGLIGMSTKFVECTLGVRYREIDKNGAVYGGAMYYMSKGFGELGYTKFGSILAKIFAVMCVMASFGGGNAMQSNQTAQQLVSLFNISGSSTGFIIGIILAIIVGLVIIGGIQRIASVTEKLVPAMAFIYVGACLAIMVMNYDILFWAFSQIFYQAFTPQAGLGGMVGVLLTGFRRASFSNEAGAGSSPIVHSAVNTNYAASEGIVSLLEPFIDTIVICTMTAIVIIIYNHDGIFEYGGNGQGQVLINGMPVGGVDLTTMAFESNISWFPYVLTVAICLFAISTMISWSYYGIQAWKYLFGRSKFSDLSYKLVFIFFIIIGASASMGSVYRFSDAMIIGLVFPNMIALLFLFPNVKIEVEKFMKVLKSK